MEFSARQLKQAEVARLHTKRLGFPGIGTLRGIVHGATVKDLPVASEGIRVQMKIVGSDPASEKGGRRKFNAKPTVDIKNMDLVTKRTVTLFIDLFFVQKLPFLIGAVYVPYSERPLYLQAHMTGPHPKGVKSLVRALSIFIGILKSHNVHVDVIKCDMEPSISFSCQIPYRDNISSSRRAAC